MSDDLYSELRKKTPVVSGGLVRMRNEAFKDDQVPGKYKILAALAIAIVIKCEPCLKGYTKLAFEKGVSEDELFEFINVALTEGGCPAEQWALKAYQTYKELVAGKKVKEEICCE